MLERQPGGGEGLFLVRMKQNLFENISFDAATYRFGEVMPGLGDFDRLIIHNGRRVFSEHQPSRIDIQNLGYFVDFSRTQAFAVLNFLNNGLICAGTECQFLLSPASFPSLSA